MASWICDGISKDGKQYNSTGAHEPYENYGPDCVICGLPQEAMTKSKKPGKTTIAGGQKPSWIMPSIIAAVVLILGAGGFGIFRLLSSSNNNTTNSNDTQTSPTTAGTFVSDNAANPQLISQGEKLLLDITPEKQSGASSFAQQNWPDAETEYQQASNNQPNDPESKIYLNNALAKTHPNPLTIAAVVPIGTSADSAKEILRGIASYQEEYNQSPSSGRFLEIVIANNNEPQTAASLAKDIINDPNILGVLGYGADPGSQQAIRQYQSAGVAVLSPLTTSLNNQILQTIPIDQKTNELFTNYLQAVSKTLAQYAAKQQSIVGSIIFYNSDSPYSLQLKQELVNAIATIKGKVVKEIDISAGNFNPDSEITNAKQNGANTIFLALSKNKVPEAVSIAKANASAQMLMLGGDELYNADILIQGGNAIENLILAVPWSFKPGDTFAADAVKSWKGRVSWRTATAYDATKALVEAINQNPTRAGVNQLLNQGITLTGSTTDFNIFNEVPLVKAVAGNSGPPGSKYQFDPVQ